MKELRYSLRADGTSDRALMPILSWLLRQQLPDHAIQGYRADRSRYSLSSSRLPESLVLTWRLYPAEISFVHRDAEREPMAKRIAEIREAVAAASKRMTPAPTVCVVPVRMTEACSYSMSRHYDAQQAIQAEGRLSICHVSATSKTSLIQSVSYGSF